MLVDAGLRIRVVAVVPITRMIAHVGVTIRRLVARPVKAGLVGRITRVLLGFLNTEDLHVARRVILGSADVAVAIRRELIWHPYLRAGQGVQRCRGQERGTYSESASSTLKPRPPPLENGARIAPSFHD